MISMRQLCQKGCRLYAAHVLEEIENETPKLEDYPVLQESKDVFLMRFRYFLQRDTLNL